MTSKANRSRKVKETLEQGLYEDTCARVTVSVDPKLLKTIDKYAQSKQISRSSIFEKALILWYENLQEEADREFYSNESEDPAVANWNKVTSKAFRYLWND
jgi:hypothetical protein